MPFIVINHVGADHGNPDGGDAVPPAVAVRLHVNENDDTHGGRAPNVVDQHAAFVPANNVNNAAAGFDADYSVPVNPSMLRSMLPANPRSLVFKGGRNYRLPANVSYVSLEELESPQEVNTCNKCLVGIVIRYKRSKSSKDGHMLYSCLSQSSKADQNFDRTMVIMCLNSQPERNTTIVTMNDSKSDQMFKQYYPGRDGPNGFGPYAVVVITRPDNITNIFGDQAGIPVLSFSTGMRLVDVPASNFNSSTPKGFLLSLVSH